MKILHITPHLGGGIGKALMTLALASRQADSRHEHSFLLLEPPEKSQFITAIRSAGCSVYVNLDDDAINALIIASDIVQLEWWNHPATFYFLCCRLNAPIRLLTWCHVSGLHTPIIPEGLISASHQCVFTSECSMGLPPVQRMAAEEKERIAVVSSGTGLSGGVERSGSTDAVLRVGYVGTMNFSKLHPEIVEFLDRVELPDFFVKVYGDDVNRQELTRQCQRLGRPELLRFEGYSTDVCGIMQSMDVMVYILNPFHYGTAENALLEAMSAGVVPVVLNNPAEMAIVQDRVTGMIVDGPETFAATMIELATCLEQRSELGKQAASSILSSYTPQQMHLRMDEQYSLVMSRGKRPVDFKEILGRSPSDWFLSCQSKPSFFHHDRVDWHAFDSHELPGLIEPTKGSILHYLHYFPDDLRLSRWVHALETAHEILQDA